MSWVMLGQAVGGSSCRDFLLVFRRDLFEAWTPPVVAVPIECTRLGHLSVFLHIPSDHE